MGRFAFAASAFRSTLLIVLFIPYPVLSQAWLPPKGEGTVTLNYQGFSVHDHFFSDGSRQDRGHVQTHGLFVNLEYGITDKMAFSVSLPFIASKYEGAFPHNPALLKVPYDGELIDTGDYHGTFQDAYLGFRYALGTGPLAITPFVAANFPTHDYTYFAHSAVGTYQKAVSFGVALGRQLSPRLPNTYFQARYAFSVVEKFDNVRASHSIFQGEFGYFVNRRLSVRALGIAQISHAGLDFPEDFLNPVTIQVDRTTERFLHHDQTQRYDFLGLGGGLSLAASERMDLFASFVTSVWGRNGHAIRLGINAGVNLYFRTGRAAPAAGPGPSN